MKRLLVVDDERGTRESLKAIFSGTYAVSATDSADGARAELAQHRADLILLDVTMPEMSGYEVCQHIRERFLPHELPVIMVTAKSGRDHMLEGLSSGIDDYMEKPVHAAELEARIKIGERIINLEANLKQNLRDIDRVRQEWEATTNAIPQLLCLVDLAGTVVKANQTATDWGLAPLEDPDGICIYDLLRPVFPDFAAYIEKIWPVVTDRLLNRRNFECEEMDPTSGHYFHAQFQPIQHPGGTGFVEGDQAFAAINIQDISERKRLELEIQEANQKSEELLLNVLPEVIALRLKQGEVNIAESFDNVTVLFADLVGFTKLTATTPPVEFIDLLNGVFSTFDYLTGHFGLEKIKTIGDSYMVVAGVPTPHDNPAHAVADFSLAMLSEIYAINEISGHSLQLRIGIDSGSVIAGVIGTTKFSYDLWGDTVNIASRMESSGEPGRIQVTQATYNLLNDNYECEERGEQDIRGYDRMVTYWLLGKRSE